MDIIWSLGLIVVILLALNHMAGGRASNVIRPVTGIVSNLVTLAVRAILGIFGSVFKIGAASIRLPKTTVKKETSDTPGPPPPRWQ